jgi:hypothetical protein
MLLREIIATVVTVLSLAAALENFGKVSFFWKLFATLLSEIIVLYFVSDRLSKWLKPKYLGFGKKNLTRSKKRAAVCGAILTAICGSFILVAWLIVHYYTINVVEVVEAVKPYNKSEFWIQAAVQHANKVSVQLPPRAETHCAPIDPPGGGRYRADITMIDWDSLNPQLEISNFSYPQRLGVRCITCININHVIVRIEPPSIKVFFPNLLSYYKYFIFITGGVIWIVTLSFLIVRSR